VTVSIYNMLGQEVRRLVNEEQRQGFHQITWNGRNGFGNPVGSGVYFYRISAGSFVSSKKMLLLK